MPYYLYYAGMAADYVTEQIGVAISDDGLNFKRVVDQPIIPVEQSRPWKNLRTCNPTVLQEANGFRMFYQGIAADRSVVIASATSPDGIRWECDSEPVLTVGSHRTALRAAEFGTADVIEPAVLKESGGYRMWFITRGDREAGNRLHHARSSDGHTWDVDHPDLLSGLQFGNRCKIFYPQVVRAGDGYQVFVSVRFANGHFVVRSCASSDGLSMGPWRNASPPRFEPSLTGRVMRRLGLGSRDYSLGVAHSHIVQGEPQRAYFHAYHINEAGRVFMDIVALQDGGSTPVKVFEPAADLSAWDSFFVADPFVVRVTGSMKHGS